MEISEFEKVWLGFIGGIIFLALLVFFFHEPDQPIDFSIINEKLDKRFDRLETGIINSALDVCFQWGGQWITDQNNFLEQDFQITLENGSIVKGQSIFCVKQLPASVT